jgi:photosystem II stability/assembly factor-like uncharacterized protein
VTWIPCSSANSESLRSVYFQDINTGYIVGENGTIQLTNDSGLTWVMQWSGTARHLNGVCITNDHLGFSIGENGTILKTGDIGVWATSLTKTAGIIIHPNPSRDRIIVEIPDFSDNSTLTVLTISGQEIMKLQMTEPRFSLDISSLKCGVYIMHYTVINCTKTGKLIKFD